VDDVLARELDERRLADGQVELVEGDDVVLGRGVLAVQADRQAVVPECRRSVLVTLLLPWPILLPLVREEAPRRRRLHRHRR
jgi:hypothetical protein